MIRFLLLILLLISTTGSNAHEQNVQKVVIFSGSITGVYYPTAGAICRELNLNKKDQLNCVVKGGNGSFQAINALKNHENNLAIIQSDVSDSAYLANGLLDKSKPFSELRWLFSLYEDVFTIIVRNDSKISSLDDIKHTKISYGSKGSGTLAMLNAIMKLKNWQMSDFLDVIGIEPSAQAEALCDGSIDVVLFSVAHPNGAIKEIMNTCEVKFISLKDKELKDILENNSNYTAATINANMYNIPKPVNSFSAKAALYTTTDLNDKAAYNIVKTIFTNLPNFRTLHPVLNQLEAEKMLILPGNIPLHPGAKKYYLKAGLMK
jgi:TRAP transporter TAXI family solute receptor